MKDYEAGIYRGEGHARWAVFCKINHFWYFAEKRGRRAAEKLAGELNRDCSTPKKPSKASRGNGPYGTNPDDWRLD